MVFFQFFSATLATLLFAISAFATTSNGNSDSMFGLPQSSAEAADLVNGLPYSTQWVSEKIGSYLYIGYNSAELASQSISIGPYTSDFGSRDYGYPTVDFFSRLFFFGDPESRSLISDFSVWGRYSLGFADRSGNLASAASPIGSSSEATSLLIFSSRIGLLLHFDRWRLIKPYAGVEVDPYFFKTSSNISAAEEQGGNYCYASLIGAHFPILFGSKGSLFAEYRKTVALGGSGQIFGDSGSVTAGMGLTF